MAQTCVVALKGPSWARNNPSMCTSDLMRRSRQSSCRWLILSGPRCRVPLGPSHTRQFIATRRAFIWKHRFVQMQHHVNLCQYEKVKPHISEDMDAANMTSHSGLGLYFEASTCWFSGARNDHIWMVQTQWRGPCPNMSIWTEFTHRAVIKGKLSTVAKTVVGCQKAF